jgi:nicotinamidase-related amidase
MADARHDPPPAPGRTALLIVDLVNDMNFEGAQAMACTAVAAARTVARLRSEADALKVPVVYVNDNYGLWRSERSKIVEHCRQAGETARELAALVTPRDGDYFVIKPQVSGFYATNLPVLLPKLGVQRLVLTGVAADICVLFTAADAHMREYELWVPADAVASCRAEHKDWALQLMAKSMAAEIRPTAELGLRAWIGADRRASLPSREGR